MVLITTKEQLETYEENGIKFKEVQWFKDGRNKQRVTEFHGDKKHGFCITYYENGQKAQEKLYVEGDLQGIALAWHKNGVEL